MSEEELEKTAKEYAVISCGSKPLQEDLRECAYYSYIDGYKAGYKDINEELKKRLQVFLEIGNAVDKQAYNEVVNENAVLKAQIEKMKCCKNCKHGKKNLEDLDFCQNCDRPYGDEVIKDEWELAE